MAKNETHVTATPEEVWDVLRDPYAYPRWVVGTDRTLEADEDWPVPDSKFKVHIFGPYTDYTHSREIEPHERIVLHAAGGPFGAAHIEITLRPEGQGTHVTITENPTGPLNPFHYFPPVHLAIRLRNVESLRRFKRIVETRAARNRTQVHSGSPA
jgi:uncharacterized protein YndB with AHSA1/START domain